MSGVAWALVGFSVVTLVVSVGLVVVFRPAGQVVPVRDEGSAELRALVEINRLLLEVVGRMVAPVPAVGDPVRDDGGWGREDLAGLLWDPSPDPAGLERLPEMDYDPEMNPHPGFQVEADL